MQSNSSRKRRLRNRNAIPPEIKILAIRNIDASDWYNKIEFELQNVSNKPIYFLLIWLTLQDTLGPSGLPVAFTVCYGDMRFYSLDELPGENDEPIKAGEKVILRISEKERKGAVELLGRGVSLDVERIDMSVNMINFGDGTGYVGGARSTKRKKNNQPSRNSGSGRETRINSPPGSAKFWRGDMPL